MLYNCLFFLLLHHLIFWQGGRGESCQLEKLPKKDLLQNLLKITEWYEIHCLMATNLIPFSYLQQILQ